MKKHKILIGLCSIMMLMACENDPVFYHDTARVRLVGPEIWTLGTDSLLFSFANFSSDIQDTVFEATLYVMGTASEVDRTVSLSIEASKTSASAELYSFPNAVTIPAGAYEASLPITISRGEALKETEVSLYLTVAANDDFMVGVDAEDHLIVRWSDILSKPSNWDELIEFFGAYSQVKYQFIIDELNMADFDLDEISWGQMKNYQIQLAEALRVYNEAHPAEPLTDENGDLISFD